MTPIEEMATAVRKLAESQQSLADTIAEEREQREALAGQVKQIQETTTRGEKALAALGGSASDGDTPVLVRTDPAYYAPERGRLAPNAKCAKAFAHFVRAVVTGSRASVDYLESCGIKLQKAGDVERAGSISDDEAGGFTVPIEFGGLILTALPRYGVAPQYCEVVPMSSDSKVYARDGNDVDVYPLEEGGQIQEANAQYSQVTLNAKLFGAFARWSESLGEDSIVSQGDAWLQRFTRAIAKKMDSCLFNGDGSSTYNNMVGLLSHADVTGVSLPAGKTGFEDTSYADIVNLIAAVADEVYEEGNCMFFASGNMHWMLANITDGVGRPIFIPDASRPDFGVFGEPMVRSATLPRLSASAAGTKFMLFGDMRRAVRLGIRTRMSILYSPHAYFGTGQNALRVLTRFGISVVEGGAMKYLKTADE